ncbi:response regulator [Scleromatobacter humisilvae]|uniref:Response regulator transcription factor n=1 Tax=Scleromatobacter humisilvae TaxID=2897159 RepID=A0A9X1YL57_9BURK|nr:response regulator transcription factor [Scleromatobacter humisilvae]MCK9687747.1 response regulator transcription factor [Scleromatobacter humisilvae]
MNPRGATADAAGAALRVRPRGDDAPARALEVYVVEDNVIVLESLIAALEELAPVRVVGTASDESVAVDWLRADGERCDLVIIDIFLRTGSGLGVIAAARQKRPGAALVVLSNYATDEMQARCLASGADRVFDKSRDIDQLVAYCIALWSREPGELPH